jgi:hypothetical protein
MMLNTELMTDEEKADAQAKNEALQAIEEGGVEVPDPPKFVEVSLATEPQGASVVVNGLLADAKTPGTFDLVADGPNEVTFYHPQYPPQRVVVDGEANAASEPVAFVPFDTEPETGTLVIESSPSAGIVYVDGERIGAAPQTLENIAAGFEHHVEVRKSGHYRSVGFFQIVPGETNEFEIGLASEDSASRKKYVEVTYDVIPKENTAVTIDGEVKGSSKLVLNQTRNTFAHVELAAPNYHTQDRYLLLHDVGTFRLRTFLDSKKREKGALTVKVLPDEANIYIGSNAYDSNPVKNLKLYEGDHTVVIEMPGRIRHEARVTVYPDRKNSYELDVTEGDLKIKRLD